MERKKRKRTKKRKNFLRLFYGIRKSGQIFIEQLFFLSYNDIAFFIIALLRRFVLQCYFISDIIRMLCAKNIIN